MAAPIGHCLSPSSRNSFLINTGCQGACWSMQYVVKDDDQRSILQYSVQCLQYLHSKINTVDYSAQRTSSEMYSTVLTLQLRSMQYIVHICMINVVYCSIYGRYLCYYILTFWFRVSADCLKNTHLQYTVYSTQYIYCRKSAVEYITFPRYKNNTAV